MDIHWRNTQKPVRFFFLDARAFVGVLFALIHARLWVFGLALLLLIAFWLFERKGLVFGAAVRAMRSWFVGRTRPANSRVATRYMIDSGSI